MPYLIKYTTWNKIPEKQAKDPKTQKGFFASETKSDAINSLLYEIRGRKSDRELAWINSVEEKSQKSGGDQQC